MTCSTCSTRSPERVDLHPESRPMPGPVFAYRLDPARTPEAGLLAAMAREQAESGLSASWHAARTAWHIRHPDSVVLAARAGTAIAGLPIIPYGDDSPHLHLLAG